jgi:hypothetical protein
MRRRVKWWLPLLAIPFWGAVWWFNWTTWEGAIWGACADYDPPAPQPKVHGVLPECNSPRHLRSQQCASQSIDCERRYPARGRHWPGPGDYPVRPDHDFGKGERGFPTLMLR